MQAKLFHSAKYLSWYFMLAAELLPLTGDKAVVDLHLESGVYVNY